MGGYPLKPMLAHDFHKHSNKIHFPCFVQPKLDGVRCLVTRTGLETFEYMSRTGKQISTMNHLDRYLLTLPIGITFDGELYIHNKDIPSICNKDISFQKLVSLIKKRQDYSYLVEYHVYDVLNDMKTEQRFEYRKKVGSNDRLKQVNTTEVVEMSDVHKYHNYFKSMGYEGVMVRNLRAKYKEGRSFDLLKYKEFDDEEFTIIGGHSGIGKSKGQVVFECFIKDKIFTVVPSVTAKERTEMLNNLEKYIGQKITVKYQGMTSDGIPRFPIGIGFRFEEGE